MAFSSCTEPMLLHLSAFDMIDLAALILQAISHGAIRHWQFDTLPTSIFNTLPANERHNYTIFFVMKKIHDESLLTHELRIHGRTLMWVKYSRGAREVIKWGQEYWIGAKPYTSRAWLLKGRQTILRGRQRIKLTRKPLNHWETHE